MCYDTRTAGTLTYLEDNVKFAIIGLPRSRTLWFSAYFTAVGSRCLHEPLSKATSEAHAEEILARCDGVSDSSLLLLPQLCEKYVVILRDPVCVERSINKRFIGGRSSAATANFIQLLTPKLTKFHGLFINYEDINVRLQEIHEYCTNAPFDQEIADQFINSNISLIHLRATQWYEALIQRNL